MKTLRGSMSPLPEFTVRSCACLTPLFPNPFLKDLARARVADTPAGSSAVRLVLNLAENDDDPAIRRWADVLNVAERGSSTTICQTGRGTCVQLPCGVQHSPETYLRRICRTGSGEAVSSMAETLVRAVCLPDLLIPRS